MAFLAFLQISAIIFNLLPVPPLDGFQALSPWMPRHWTARLQEHSTAAFWIVVLVIWYVPAANALFWTTTFAISSVLGIDPGLARSGWQMYQFWRH